MGSPPCVMVVPPRVNFGRFRSISADFYRFRWSSIDFDRFRPISSDFGPISDRFWPEIVRNRSKSAKVKSWGGPPARRGGGGPPLRGGGYQVTRVARLQARLEKLAQAPVKRLQDGFGLNVLALSIASAGFMTVVGVALVGGGNKRKRENSDFGLFGFSTPVLLEIGVSRARERHDELCLEKLVRRDQTRASKTHMATQIVKKTVENLKIWFKFGSQKREKYNTPAEVRFQLSGAFFSLELLLFWSFRFLVVPSGSSSGP